MTAQKKEQIRAAWERIDSEEPDISTEQLMARVCDECDCDCGNIGEALQ